MSAPLEALCERLVETCRTLELDGPEAAARSLTGLDRLIDAAVEAAPTPVELQRVRAALATLERIAAETSDALRQSLLRGWTGARAERAYRGG